MNSEIFISNLKCGGCANTIRSKLLSISGIGEVNVVEEDAKVIIKHDDNVNLNTIINALKKIGYPAVGASNSVMDKAKSYVSCMIGRIAPPA